MRRNVTVLPQGDPLCLFCASRILATPPAHLRLPLRLPRRSLHIRSRLEQAPVSTSTKASSAQHDASPASSDAHSGGSSGGWGTDDGGSMWKSKVKILGKKEEPKATPQVRQTASTQGLDQRWRRQTQEPAQGRGAPGGGFRLKKHDMQSREPAIQGRMQNSPTARSTLSKQESLPFQEPPTRGRVQATPRGGFKMRKQEPLSRDSQAISSNSSIRKPESIGQVTESQGRQTDGIYRRQFHGDYYANTARSSESRASPWPRSIPNDTLKERKDHRAKDIKSNWDPGFRNGETKGLQADRKAVESTTYHLDLGSPRGAAQSEPEQQFSAPIPSVEPDPDLERFKNERMERLRRANYGEIVGWGSGENKTWGTQGPDELKLEPTTTEPQSAPNDVDGSQSQEAPLDDKRQKARRFSRFESPPASGDRRRARHTDLRRMRQMGRGFDRRSDGDDENTDLAAVMRMEQREQRKAEKARKKAEAPPTPIVLPEFISIGNLAAALHVKHEDFSQKLHELGFEDFSNDHILDAENAGLIAQEFNFEPTAAQLETASEDLVAAPEAAPEDKELMLNRPPVITIMGHVDHGKTTLLDFLRKSSVAAGEHGGITQHIGAFTVEMSSGRTITFLDTPGHSAFLEMRQRGANVTDIVILVVAADDSVKPQTLEAIKHAQAAGVPMIVAMSKIDKEDANPDRVKRDLASHGVEVEDFGGDVQAIPVSGKTGEGMEDLEDAAIALADVLDVRADTSGAVEGWVLESKLKPQGRVATVLMKRGTLRPGALLVAGTTWTRVRTLRNEAGQAVPEATPGQPIEVDGWDDTPDAGAEALEAPNMQRVREVCELRRTRVETEKLAGTISATNEQREAHRAQRAIAKEQQKLANSTETDEARSAELAAAAELARSNATSKVIEAPVIVRGDVAGSVEAVSAAVLAMGNNEIRTRILREEVGAITESDVELASVAQGIIINFGLSIPGEVRRMADKQNVRIVDGNIIYRITEAFKDYLEDKLPPIRTPRVIGEADVAQVFEYKTKDRGVVNVAGCKVTNGIVERGKRVKIFRAGSVVYDGILSSLKNHKRDVDTMQQGTECGMSFEKFTNFAAGDKIQSYEIHEERRKL